MVCAAARHYCTLMSHLLMSTKFSDIATFRGSARSCHISFHIVKY